MKISPLVSLGVSFSPAGLLSPFHFGASARLRALGYISDETHLAGSSGGALAAVTTALGLDQLKLVRGCEYISEECRRKGTRLTLRLALDEIMQDYIPYYAADSIRKREGEVIIAYTEVFPRQASRLISDFESKEDLIDVLRASCNIPFYFNGNSPFVKVRGAEAVDGFFAIERQRFGCPRTVSDMEIIVCPFDPAIVGLDPSMQAKPTTKSNLRNFATLNNNFNAFQNQNQQLRPKDSKSLQPVWQPNYSIISPAILAQDEWPFTLADLLQLALRPPDSNLCMKLQHSDPMHGVQASSEVGFVYNFLYDRGALAVDKWNDAMTSGICEVN